MRKQLEAIPGIESVHDLHVWTVTSGVVAMSVHAIVREPDMPEVLARIGMEALRHNSPEEFASDITTAIASWARAIQVAKIEPE